MLLHGAPGSGKSQLVRSLAQALGCALHQVPDTRPTGEVLKGPERLASLVTMQYMLQGSSAHLVLFDEVEDAFPWVVDGGWMRPDSGKDKGRTNRLLEENPVPCLWLGNRISQLDPAFVRHFSLVLELPGPPRHVREGLLASHSAQLGLPATQCRKLAEDPAIMPADVARAARVTRLVRIGSVWHEPAADRAPGGLGASSPPQDGEVFERALRGGRRSEAEPRSSAELDYDPELVNASVPLERLIRGLRDHGEACICLYGPPGTGKTAFARQVASALGRPLMRRSASDLLDMYVGGTEKAIAQMFEEASRSDCVLLLDEAEGLMRHRNAAVRSFEVTQVNELLVRMETFRGVFLCATNGFESLDSASHA